MRRKQGLVPTVTLDSDGSRQVRRFACTSCGRCCDRGPELELGETAALAGTFITSLMFKAQSIPLSQRTERAAQWWLAQKSRIPLRAAFAEKRRYLALFASRRRSERQNHREVYLTISAVVDDNEKAKCPALKGALCSIYDQRPLTCRTVPLHYSRPPSVLQSYIDHFTATPGYECETVDSPVILSGSTIVSTDLSRDRTRAAQVANADRGWKEKLLSFMNDPHTADQAELPTYETVLANADKGYATSVPMIVAWRIAEYGGIISSGELQSICEKQAALLEAEIKSSPLAPRLRELLRLYEAGAAGRDTLSHRVGFVRSAND